MKKILLSAVCILSFSIFASAQTSATSTTSTTTSVQATQTVNAADMQKTEAEKCETKKEECTTTAKTCCTGHNRSDMNSSASTTVSATGAELAKSAESCKTVSFGMSAEKPKKIASEETPKK